jgi:hypothetical protein
MQVLNQGLNRDLKSLKFSYMVLSSSTPPVPSGYLVISTLLKEKGRKKCYLCTPDGRVELVRLNKHVSTLNNAYDRIKKGAIVALQDIEKKRGDYWIVKKESRVQLLYGKELL